MADETDPYEGNLQTSGAPEGTSGDMDERLATLVHLQQLQQKQEVVQRMETKTAANADAGFRRGLEELVRDHLNTCMALASCSSLDPGISSSSSSNLMSRPSSYIALHDASENTHHSLDDQNDDLNAYHTTQSHDDMLDQYDTDQEQRDYEQANPDQLVQDGREAEANLVNTHASPQEQPRSSILSIWAAQRAQEMITTMERQAREAELLALAGLHTVSTLDASFLRESLATGDSSLAHSSLNGEERRRGRPSSMVQMWRELEERRTERVRHDFAQRVSPPADSSHASGNTDVSASSTDTRLENEVGQTVFADASGVDMQSNENTEVMLQSQNVDYTDWEGSGIERIETHANPEVSAGDSTHIQEGEREHVRQIVQRLTTDNGVQAISSDEHTQSRSAWLDENERERVRELAREWVRVTNEQRAVMQDRGRQRPQRTNRAEQARERGLPAQTESLNGNAVQGLSRRERRFLNRQVILDMLMRVENERQRELQLLVEHRAVSDFAHRHRLQSFLRGRFLRTGAVNEEERVPSSAAGELGQLRQRRAVSDLREGFRFRLESILRSQVNNRDAEQTNTRGPPTQRRRRRRSEDQPAVQPMAGESPRRRWAPQESASRGWQRNPAPRPVAEFQSMDESTEYNMELQELLGRRSVTNVLASEFRDRLDRLIRSFLQSQGRSPVAWDVPRTEVPHPPQQNQRRPRQQAQWRQEAQVQQPTAIPPPPPPPPQPLWQQELQQGLWQRPPPSLHRSHYTDGEVISDLRTDVSKLQQGMADLHRMMETCLEMQLDLQRSLRQELAGALQQVYEGKVIPEEAIDGSKWISVKRGICCVCCDRNIDSLLYRCGHMCTCLNCASELIRKSGKCPMCRAPIKEVVRAFTVA